MKVRSYSGAFIGRPFVVILFPGYSAIVFMDVLELTKITENVLNSALILNG